MPGGRYSFPGAWTVAITAYLRFNSIWTWLAASLWPEDEEEYHAPCLMLLPTPLAIFEAYGGKFGRF